jgi:glycine/D-amino acid oxidase-like deaminating enzyme
LKQQYDFIVVGAGIAGSFLALELSKRSKVLLVDKGSLLGGATASAAEIITLQLPKPFLTWTLDSLKMYEEIGAPIRRIEAILATTEKCAERYLRILSSSNVETWVLTRSEAARESGLELKDVEGYVFIATLDALLDTGGLGNLMRYLLDMNNVDLVEDVPAKVKGSRVIVGDKEVEASGAIIVSAGAWTPEVLNMESTRLAGSRLYRFEAHSVEIGKSVKTIFYEDSSGSYLVPESSKTVTVGDGTNETINSPEEGFTPRPGSVYEVLEGLSKVVADVETAVPRTSWSAPCLITGDGWPVVGKVRDNVYVLSGLNGVGLMIAPALARILANHLLKGYRIPQRLNPLREVSPWEGPPKEPPEPYRLGC